VIFICLSDSNKSNGSLVILIVNKQTTPHVHINQDVTKPCRKNGVPRHYLRLAATYALPQFQPRRKNSFKVRKTIITKREQGTTKYKYLLPNLMQALSCPLLSRLNSIWTILCQYFPIILINSYLSIISHHLTCLASSNTTAD